jgi:uncharacterized protein YyaL (SSP411 family)
MANRLAGEVSPYLLQHANNPVDWYPWGADALARAAREDRPILLSIGYSACHWCHVMERESFENADIARLMNERFVSIKVDREERPDLDQIYQLVVQLMGKSGGWPLTVFLTPDRKPFFGGTYFPPTQRYGMPSFPRVLESVSDAYNARRDDVEAHALELTRAIVQVAGRDADGEGTSARSTTPPSADVPSAPPGRGRYVKADVPLTAALVSRATEKLVARFDEHNGGFGHRPKFPNTMSLDLLLRAGDHARVGHALDAMRNGGIFDQLGGGFHRYSTDERWLVPHFEKMLYDNALLLRLYVDAWRALGDSRYADTARRIAEYVMREMQAPDGGFYSSQDADSEGEEGKYFVWTPRQVETACQGDEEAASAAKRVWGITAQGNFEEGGSTVLSVVEPPRDDRERDTLERARQAMWSEREKRPKPFRDEKILASWNALMAAAMADAGAALDDPSLVVAAERAMSFVERVLVIPDQGGSGRLRVLRMAKDLAARGSGFLDDHAYVADAALDLYDATASARWVALARSIADSILAHFHDPDKAGFFFVADDGEKLVVRSRDPHDHAVPSGVAVACRVLLRLAALVDSKYEAPAAHAVAKLAVAASENPFGMGTVVCLVDRLVRGSVDIALVGKRATDATGALAREVFRTYLPDRTMAWIDPSDPRSLDACRVLAEGKPAQGEPLAYVCRGRTCSLPIMQAEMLRGALKRT